MDNFLLKKADEFDEHMFAKFNLSVVGHSILSIYEDLVDEEHYRLVSFNVPSPSGPSPSKKVTNYSEDGHSIRFVLKSINHDDVDILHCTNGSYQFERGNLLFQSKNWVQLNTVGGFFVLVLFKSRIFEQRTADGEKAGTPPKKDEKKKKNK